jgi:protein-S-isoprenylcysteine O-methyltransferase Ste14
MQLVPTFRLELQNGWLLLLAYFLGLTLSVLTYPSDKRKKLFSEPTYPRRDPRWAILALGTTASVAFVALTLFVPLSLKNPLVFCAGLLLYSLGYLTVMVSLLQYRKTPVDGVVRTGLYRYSRNPQWLGLATVFAGTSLATASGLHLILLAVIVSAYHFRILREEEVCEVAYGQSYREYKRQVPRYLFL